MISQSEEHTMYALNKDGNRTGQSITIQDRAIFDGLTATGEASDYAASFTGGNPTELASVFLFGADNSNAEWRFSRYDEGNGDQYAIGTVHNDGLAISPEQMGFARENEIAFIHSHPGNYKSVTGPFSEHSSMGSLPGGRIINRPTLGMFTITPTVIRVTGTHSCIFRIPVIYIMYEACRHLH